MVMLRLMMLKGATLDGYYDLGEHQFPAVGLTVNDGGSAISHGSVDDVMYGSDEFRMYAYKIKRCPRTRSHDWTECPYAHRGEKATRRDPRRFGYCAVTCPAFRNGGVCHRGETCEFAHGVFEYWLHPARYRTRTCNAGSSCRRKVCFFAHTPEQLRSDQGKHRSRFAYRLVRANGRDFSGNGMGSDGGESATWVSPVKITKDDNDSVSGLLKSLSGMNVRDDKNEASDLDLSHIDWISKLVD